MSRTSKPLITIENISKSYGGVQALSKVCLNILPGEVHGLCGENGAGKSTLIKCLAGVVSPETGTITVDGKPLSHGDIHAAEAAGIAVIHQESTAFLDLDLVENLFVGREIKKYGWLNRRAMERQALAVMHRLDVTLDLHTPLREFSIAQRQMVEMARACLRDCRLLIMDEPTASLSARETKTLLGLVKQLRESGVSVLYVSHRLEEIAELCDRVTVFRDGRLVATTSIDQLDRNQLIGQMVGREINALPRREERAGQTDEVRASITGLCSRGNFSEISFEVRAGEILGIGGLVGAGRSEVARAIFGADRYDQGEIKIDGASLKKGSIQAAIEAGIAMVPEDRQHQGLILPMSVSENLSLTILTEITRHRLIHHGHETAQVQHLMRRLAVKAANAKMEAASLSGGNQQKVVLGKWLAIKPKFLILDEPTRGVDVAAKAEIHRLIRELTEAGMATLIMTSDLPELLTLSDRIQVMCEGRIAGQLDGATATEEQVMRLAFPRSEAQLT
ncbi:MAG: sugar ABC transporter ATP-binding protein [Planctomycetaceae bacterium]|nr:sugar ABC transporter ATP-binding protein [Planctomycetaceae bacterium]